MRVWNAKKGWRWWSKLFLTFSDFCHKHYRLPLPVFCFKNDHYRWRPPCDNLQIAVPNLNVSQKSTRSRVNPSMFMLIYALFISFHVRHTDNIRFDGRHCIGDLIAHAMIGKLLYSKFDRSSSSSSANNVQGSNLEHFRTWVKRLKSCQGRLI